jgi:signal transduction histidine kinase
MTVAAVLLSLVVVAAGATAARAPGAPLVAVLVTLAVGWSFLTAGRATRARRPADPTGRLLVVAGWIWLLRAAGFLPSPVAFAAGEVLEKLGFALLAHLLVVLPSGRATGRTDRVLVGAGYVLLGPLWWAVLATLDPALAGCAACPGNALLQPALAPAGRAALAAHDAASLVLVLALLAHTAVRWRRTTAPGRRVLGPVALGGVAVLVLALVDQVGLLVATPRPPALAALAVVATPLLLALWPIGLLAGLARRRLDRSAVGDLVVELGAGRPPGRVEAALARALHDPTARLLHRLGNGWADADGRPVDPPGGDGRAVTLLRRDGEPVAALVHDPALADQPELVEAVAAAAGLALDNERLQAELRGQLAAVRASRARIVEAGDAARRQVERDLHDGAQQRLLTVALGLRAVRAQVDPASPAAAALDPVVEEFRAALAELRDLARGLHPALLDAEGLAAALDALVQRSPVPAVLTGAPAGRLPAPVERAAWFVVAEALTNAARHARAGRVEVGAQVTGGQLLVTVRDDGAGGADPAGQGLRGLADRVAALDGSLAVDSTPGRGTVVTATLPCG